MKYRDGVPDIRLVASEELTCGKRLRKEERFHESELFLGKRRLTLEVYTQPVKCSHGPRDRVAKYASTPLHLLGTGVDPSTSLDLRVT